MADICITQIVSLVLEDVLLMFFLMKKKIHTSLIIFVFIQLLMFEIFGVTQKQFSFYIFLTKMHSV